MSSYLRKSVAMGPFKFANGTSNLGYTRQFYAETNTPYVRMWVDWTQLAPYKPNSDGSIVNAANDTRPLPNSPGTVRDYVNQLDQQLVYARQTYGGQAGLKIVLTFWTTPFWASGLSSPSVQPGGLDSAGVDPNQYALDDRKSTVSGKLKNLLWATPSDTSINGYWATYLYFVMARWSSLNPNNGGAYADFVEIMNEPNNQWWPQVDRSSANPSVTLPRPEAHVVAGRLMNTARQIQIATGFSTPKLVGPAVVDTPRGTDPPPDPIVTDGQAFVSRLKGYLQAVSFDGGTDFAWSQHNYYDVKALPVTTYGSRTVDQLRGWWKGWPRADASDPYVLMTEGGYFPAGGAETVQASNLRQAHTRLHNDTLHDGAGQAMFTNYLWWTDPNFDSGLLTAPSSAQSSAPPPPSSYGKRPAYLDPWAKLPPT